MTRAKPLPHPPRLAFPAFALALGLALAGCGPNADAPARRSFASREAPWFEEVTAQIGVNFHHNAGLAGEYFMPESAGSGGALFDFDQDGRLDVYLIHNAPPDAASRSKNRLFHQQADGTFRDASEGSGLDVSGYGMGATAGDLNNDGLPELFLTEYGRVRLFRNLGDGRFEDVTGPAGIRNDRWATAAGFFDYDRDGWLDVVVANYVDYSGSLACHDTRGAREYCGPQGMAGTSSRLFRNLGPAGDGALRFEDATVVAGLATRTGPALGLVCADFNGDHWPDILVADDGMANRLFVNQRNGRFEEEAVRRGIAYDALGASAANMGVAIGDVDGNGLADVFITHVSWENHGMWMQDEAGLFQDRTASSGLANLAWRGTGFGTVLADFDLDGDLDLVLANGRIKRGEDTGDLRPGLDPFWRLYAQRNQLLANDGTGQFQDVSESNPALCGHRGMGRGLACGDLDNDGRLDLVVMHAGGPVQVLRNVAVSGGHWLSVRAIVPALGGRDAYGAEVTVQGGGRRWSRLVQPSYSYLVSNDPRAHFGLGSVDRLDVIEVVWPDGSRERFAGGAVDRSVVLSQGTGGKP